MILLVLGFFAVLFGAVLLLELEEVFAQLQSRVRMRVAAFARSNSRQTKPQDAGNVAPGPTQEVRKAGLFQTLHSETGSPVAADRFKSQPWPPVREASSTESSYESESESEDEPSDEMMYHANMVTADHAFSFPRVGISIRVQPPPIDDFEDFRGRTLARARARGISEQPQRDLLRVHEGYMFIEDRLLRFKTSGGGGGKDKTYEAWQDSRWRPAKRQEIWVQNGDAEDVECVALICVLDRSECWTPLRVRESGWVECT